MKWYFAISEASLARDQHDWAALLKTAVNSAARNTTLRPYLLYDGQPNALTEELARRGVTIIPHRVSLYDTLAAYAGRMGHGPLWLAVAAAAFLRFDIPLIEQDDELVLYTDVDVVFRSEPRFFRSEPPALFGASSQSTAQYDDMNSGVMLINVASMRRSHAELCAFTAANLDLGLDQEVLRVFYKDRYDLLDRSLNWKPYWGVNPDAQIVHFHGPKPVAVRRFLADGTLPGYVAWQTLLEHGAGGFRAYLDLWDAFADPDRVICRVDLATDGYVAGWAIYERLWTQRVEFKVLLDGVEDGSIVCDQPRPDVASAGFASLCTGFRYCPPPRHGGPARRLELVERHGLAIELFVEGRAVEGSFLLRASG